MTFTQALSSFTRLNRQGRTPHHLQMDDGAVQIFSH
jgi:hypothetical protein